MNIDNYISFDNDDGFDYKPSFPLFNFDVIRDTQIEENFSFNFISHQNISGIVEDIIYKKTKVEEETQIVAKKRGRKAIVKNGKQWDDANITLKEIIENDLAGAPTQLEIKMREERSRKIRETKALKKAQREKGTTVEIPAIENSTNLAIEANSAFGLGLEPLAENYSLAYAPQIIFKDGKIVIDTFQKAENENKRELVIAENKKPYKLNSMSFRPKKAHTARWTAEETRKFFKAIEIFGADFSLIAKLFPTRNRDQIKNKFTREEKTNTKMIDDAFKRNSILGKRSLMDRIRTFNNSVKSGELMALTNNELSDNLGGLDKLERRLSNTSTDSMDLRIMEEIQDIFIKEIRPANSLLGLGSFAFTENVETEGVVRHFDLDLDLTTREIENANKKESRKEEEDSKKKNLLLRFM